MTQQPPQAPKAAAPQRRKKTRRRSRQGGVSPFVIMAVIGVIFVVVLVAFQLYSTGVQTRNVAEAGRTLVKDGANPAVTIIEFSDFQ